MDRIDTYVTKILAVHRFNSGAMPLANEDVALTSVFNNFLRYLLDEWVEGEPVSPDDGPKWAERINHYLKRYEGLREPNRQITTEFLAGPDAELFPVLSVLWLLRYSHIKTVVPYLTPEWKEFVAHYRHALEALGPACPESQ